MVRQISVVGAVIVRDDAVLCALRGPRGALAGFWEFPGGKIEPDETARVALQREVSEELGCEIDVGDEVTTTTYAYEFGDVALTTFWCDLTSGDPHPLEHAELRWVQLDRLDTLRWAPADVPAVRIISAHRR